jgi:hypothetical protein
MIPADGDEERVMREVASMISPDVSRLGSFMHRGLSAPTIEVLIQYGIDAPERLLFMTEFQIRDLPRLNLRSLAEIESYRTKFVRAKPNNRP